MAKVREVFVCKSCGGVQSRWVGKCPDCGSWDSLQSERRAPPDPHRALAGAWSSLGDGADSPKARRLSEIDPGGSGARRLPTGIGELDRVLGGGLVAGSAVLVGGAPGIGKSTLMLQAARSLAAGGTGVLYVSSEESGEQVTLRAQRLGGAAVGAELLILADTSLARIIEQARQARPGVLMVDSVQMVYSPEAEAAPGSVSQLRRCCAELVQLAKVSGIAVVLVGHITKDGQLAGPRLLEHLVDAVLSFEGDRYHAHRVVRAVKNRFGTTAELGIFEMTAEGLRQVPEGAGAAALPDAARPGSVVCPAVSGTRCILVEVQALTATGFLGAAKRKSSGLDPNRLAMVIAVLEQHAGMRLADRDIFASAVGGIRIGEPAADLALLLAIAGAQLRRALAPATAAAGEVGLGGEVRPISHLDQRTREAARLGYKRLLVPHGGAAPRAPGIEVIPVRSVAQAIQELG